MSETYTPQIHRGDSLGKLDGEVSAAGGRGGGGGISATGGEGVDQCPAAGKKAAAALLR